jgi:hypothetical protein
MTIQTNITVGRKVLATQISERLLGAPVVYAGVPSCAYNVGTAVTIDRQGNIEITGDDALTILKPFFIEQRWMEAGSADAETDLAAAPDSIPDPERTAGIDTNRIAIPAAMTVAQLTNLIHILYSKQYLLNRAVMDGRLVIPEALIARLKEHTPETVEAFCELLNDFKALGELDGFEYEDGIVRMDFPYDEAKPERWVAYAGLVGRIVHAAKAASRVKAERQTCENEKYYMRAWLLRLGYGGADLKAERKLLLQTLKGHSAFPNDDAAGKHKEKYAALRRAARDARMEGGAAE